MIKLDPALCDLKFVRNFLNVQINRKLLLHEMVELSVGTFGIPPKILELLFLRTTLGSWAISSNKMTIHNKGCSYNLINNFSIIACGARRARSCATAHLLVLTGEQHTLRAGIVCVDRELLHQIIAWYVEK